MVEKQGQLAGVFYGEAESYPTYHPTIQPYVKFAMERIRRFINGKLGKAVDGLIVDKLNVVFPALNAPNSAAAINATATKINDLIQDVFTEDVPEAASITEEMHPGQSEENHKASLRAMYGTIGACLNLRLLNALKDVDLDRDALIPSLHSRRYLENNGLKMMVDGLRSGEASIVAADLDGFKYINDTYGHAAGDEVLARVGELISSICRPTEIACRFGGDEIFIVCPQLGREKATKLAQRIVDEIASLRFRFGEPPKIERIGVSVGVGSMRSEEYDFELRKQEMEGKSREDAVINANKNCFATLRARADKNLYNVKRAGKGAVCATMSA